ncbi:Oidioi.mRNA.OKI2018_I69.XSR.g14336.t1.cds [Oikopleura dioica]|uniref:Oidioi.mRNA.OKI2018_I69.XSR.g14336.t1.cds n=1 Tax=Oikopleura dioica TaxID=34765 RepID=A0ABN7SA14_OIKDI|nr:Oidioi.mRNA.OKI2018_I69.XSR.g14336.t1.cds [Oikopleura dioica]
MVELYTEKRSGLPRDVWKWIFSLDLPRPVKNVRRDFQNGELIGYILNHYYCRNEPVLGWIEISQMNQGTSFNSMNANWDLVRRFLARPENSDLVISKEEIDGIVHAKPGAIELVLIGMFQFFTGKEQKTLVGEYNFDFNDGDYQNRLPFHARNTATSSVKANTKITETLADGDTAREQLRNSKVLSQFELNKVMMKAEHPQRFNVVPPLDTRSRKHRGESSKKTTLQPSAKASVRSSRVISADKKSKPVQYDQFVNVKQ